jgi:hypothetical protein
MKPQFLSMNKDSIHSKRKEKTTLRNILKWSFLFDDYVKHMVINRRSILFMGTWDLEQLSHNLGKSTETCR